MNRIYPFFAAFALLALPFFIYSCSDSSTGADSNKPTFNSKEAPGQAATHFLRDEHFTDLEVEIDYMPGHAPTQNGLDSLMVFLEQRLNKQNITFREPTEIPSGGQSSYTATDIRSIEEENRNHYTTDQGSTLQVYFLMVDGNYEQTNVLGIAYWNTSVAFFGKKIEEVSSGIGAPPEEKIEGTVFRHEFGHNMGLVGNGTETQTDHKTEGSAHCTTEGCLMQPTVETGDFFANFFDGNIPGLKSYCRQDLEANGGK